MSPPRVLLAAALLVAAPVVAVLALGVPSIGGLPGVTDDAGTPEPFVDVQTATPTAAARQTAAATATETPDTDAQSKTSRPDTGTLSPTVTPSNETETATDSTSTAEPDDGEDRPPQTPTETVSPDETPTHEQDHDTPAASTDRRAKTSTDSPTSSDSPTSTDAPTPTDSPTRTESPTPTESATPSPTQTDSPTPSASPTRTETPPATDGGEDDPAARQCTHDRDGHDKPPLPDAVEPPTDAERVASGERVSGSVGADESHWYAIDVQQGETLSAVVEGSPEPLSVAIFAPDGTPVDAITTATPDRTAFGAPVEQSGTYYVRVRAGDGYGGFYRLTAERAGPDSFDPNGDRSRALPVASGSETTATLTEGETDWFAIKLPANSTLSATVTVDGHALGRDVRVDVYDADGTLLSSGDDGSETTFHPAMGSNSATASARTTEEGVYYVRVHCAALDGHATYTVSVESNTEN